MKNFFKNSKPNQFNPPPGPPPPTTSHQNSIPMGAAAEYYGYQSNQQPPTLHFNNNNQNQNVYYPPPISPQNQYPSPISPQTSSGFHHQSNHHSSSEDLFSMLSRYDTVILVDDSGSMEMFWDETRDALIGVVQKAVQYDSDGIDLFFFNDHRYVSNCNSSDQVKQIFSQVLPRRSTPTLNSIKKVLDPYLNRLHQAKLQNNLHSIKPLNLVILTDGAPDRGQDPEPLIVEKARWLDTNRLPLNQVGLSFVQIGNDREASQHLKRLDDDLKTKYKIRDYVDCTPYQNCITSDFILKALIGGINRKIDGRRI
ncbi:hypothetical protein O181_091799 [Austropuccinia psidii MF-1]|uniref:VWFA domain-containing protein n=1 Tax=Austropuccinia psidii MF-1 TaxID=1389203 RepID=A0A9Q3IYA0_9BASI|nr:hypothetical protein [Austropuccinia psidii MF-1]